MGGERSGIFGQLVLLTLVVLAVVTVKDVGAQTQHVVGDSFGWKQPPNGSFYALWASNKTFRVGDTLVFTFTTGVHDVARTSRADFNSCNKNIPESSIQRTGPVTITLNATGQHYYYCTFDGHCASGQKLSINVVNSSTPSPPGMPPATGPSTPPPPASTGGPPPPSSAPSLAVAGFFVPFLSVVAVGFLMG